MSLRTKKYVHASGTFYRHYESSTGQTLGVLAGVDWKDDFIGDTTIGEKWTTLDVSATGDAAPIIKADTATGKATINLDATNEAQDSAIYFGDQRCFDVSKGLIFECKITVTSAAMTGIRFVAGMVSDHNLDKDTVAESLWFSMDGDLVLDAESDDNTTNNDDKTTGTTWVTTESHILMIDMTNLSSVLFFVDGAAVATSTTFDADQLSATTAIMQPYFSLDKASGTALCVADIDYVRVFGNR